MPLDILADAISIGTLLAFNLVCAGVLIIRYKGGDRPYIPVIVVVAFVVMAFIYATAFERGLPMYVSAAFEVLTLLLVFLPSLQYAKWVQLSPISSCLVCWPV